MFTLATAFFGVSAGLSAALAPAPFLADLPAPLAPAPFLGSATLGRLLGGCSATVAEAALLFARVTASGMVV